MLWLACYLLFQYHICKRKLDSKCEALLILSKELDECRSERDQFKLMAEQLRARYQDIKRQINGLVSNNVVTMTILKNDSIKLLLFQHKKILLFLLNIAQTCDFNDSLPCSNFCMSVSEIYS